MRSDKATVYCAGKPRDDMTWHCRGMNPIVDSNAWAKGKVDENEYTRDSRLDTTDMLGHWYFFKL